MKLYMLRHAETEVERERPSREWDLTNNGHASAQSLADTGVFDGVECIYSSTEKKALQTALPIATRLGLDFSQVNGLKELHRGDDFVSSDIYEARVQSVLHFQPIDAWESAEDALARFYKAIHLIESGGHDTALVVSHGIVLTLYFSTLLNQQNMAFERWKQLRSLSWGLVIDGIVARDILTV